MCSIMNTLLNSLRLFETVIMIFCHNSFEIIVVKWHRVEANAFI